LFRAFVVLKGGGISPPEPFGAPRFGIGPAVGARKPPFEDDIGARFGIGARGGGGGIS